MPSMAHAENLVRLILEKLNERPWRRTPNGRVAQRVTHKLSEILTGIETLSSPLPLVMSGACCDQDGVCLGIMSQVNCEIVGGTWVGGVGSCSPDPCIPPN